MALHDFLPDEKLREVRNLHDFAGMLVFDKWVCNTNGRQTVFFEEAPRMGGGHAGGRQPLARRREKLHVERWRVRKQRTERPVAGGRIRL